MIATEQTYENMMIYLDGSTFVECRFIRCTLSYSGLLPVHLERNAFDNCNYAFTGPAAATMAFLTGLYHGGGPVGEQAVEQIFEDVRTGKVGDIAPFDSVGPATGEHIMLSKQGDIPCYDLRDHPEIAAILGQISALWAAIEFELCSLFCWAIGCTPVHGAAAYWELATNKARRDMIRGLLQYLHTDDERKSVTEILSQVGTVGGIRNKYAHQPWLRRGNAVYLMNNIGGTFPHGNINKVTVKILAEDAQKIETCWRQLQATVTILTKARPLYIHYDFLPPALRKKFRLPPAYRMIGDAPRNQATSSSESSEE
jgi:hypothetical protein